MSEQLPLAGIPQRSTNPAILHVFSPGFRSENATTKLDDGRDIHVKELTLKMTPGEPTQCRVELYDVCIETLAELHDIMALDPIEGRVRRVKTLTFYLEHGERDSDAPDDVDDICIRDGKLIA